MKKMKIKYKIISIILLIPTISLILILYVSAQETENNCDCVYIRNQTYNSSQIEWITDTLLNKVEELENPISNESCRFIINQLNSNIFMKNNQIKYQRIFIFLLISALLLIFLFRLFKSSPRSPYPEHQLF